MKSRYWLLSMALAGTLLCWGCGKGSSGSGKIELDKPVEQVKADAGKMNVDDLKAQAEAYKKALLAKKAEADVLQKKLKDTPLTQMLSSETSKLKDRIAELTTSTSKISERLNVYVDELKSKKVDVGSLETK